MGRKARGLLDPASMNPEQLTSTPTKQDLVNEEIQKLAVKTHLEVHQREDTKCFTGKKIQARSSKDGNQENG